MESESLSPDPSNAIHNVHPETEQPQKITPLPMKQIIPLITILITESITTTMLFPFVGFMVAGFGYKKEEVGFYAGFIASCFNFAQLFSSVFWGWLSDRRGRRTILLVGMVGNIVTVIIFGMSQNLTMAILARLASGLMNGNVGVAKTYLGEITDQTNQAKGLSMVSITWGMGVIIGPLIGGLFSDPVGQFGWENAFLHQFPFLLPCIITASITTVGLFTGFFFLTETLHKNKTSPQPPPDSPPFAQVELDEIVDAEPHQSPPPDKPVSMAVRTFRRMKQNSVFSILTEATPLLCLSLYVVMAGISIVYDEVYSLWCITDIQYGGLGFDEKRVGLSMIPAGIITITANLFLVPILDRKIGPISSFKIGNAITLIQFALLPTTNLWAGYSDVGLWFQLVFCVLLRSFGSTLSFTNMFILINNCVSRDRLGTMNGLGQSSAALARAFGPAVGGVVYAWSITEGHRFPFDSYFVFLTLSLLSFIQFFIALRLPTRLNKRFKKIEVFEG
eukprot:TRINITY_DN4736_c0_g1_i2.p1 TRINITY_DN4736_c0_g1~~TRINITY_DN4736_c0_g1_i2.p1  ORF type:complete len:505 (-),score=111.80 TRINITY_DN4736_c0_g1_i2:22-1536(-)